VSGEKRWLIGVVTEIGCWALSLDSSYAPWPPGAIIEDLENLIQDLDSRFEAI